MLIIGTNPKKLVKCMTTELKINSKALAKKAVKKELKRGRISTRSSGSSFC